MTGEVTYHGRLVPAIEPINELTAELEKAGVTFGLVDHDGSPAVAIRERIRLYWDNDLSVFVGVFREWDFVRKCVDEAWTPVEFLPHTANARWFVVHPHTGVAVVDATWAPNV